MNLVCREWYDNAVPHSLQSIRLDLFRLKQMINSQPEANAYLINAWKSKKATSYESYKSMWEILQTPAKLFDARSNEFSSWYDI